MKRSLPLIGAVVLILATPLMAYAESVSWTGGSGLGSDVLPCSDGGHWLLSNAQSVKSATLVVAGGTFDMQPDGKDDFVADSSGPILIGDLAVVTYDGGGQPSLALTGCVASSSPSPDPSPDPSPSPSDSPSPTPPPGGGHNGGGSGGSGGGGTGGGSGSIDGTPVLGGGGGGTTPAGAHTSPAQKKLHDLAAAHGPLPAAIHRAITSDPSHQNDAVSNGELGAADGAVQQAWNDGASDPFQDAGHQQRGLVLAVIAIVAVGVGGAFVARRHLINATT